MKSEFTKDVMKLATKYSLIDKNDSFIEESLEKLALQNKIPIKISQINSEIFGIIFNLGESEALEVNNG